ncbi:MAG: TolC family protein [Phycisphaerales bacterium]
MLKKSPQHAVLVAIIGLSGCGNDLRDIDARTDAAMRERSAALGRDTLSPSRAGLGAEQAAPSGGAREARRRSLLKSPATTNPDASDLPFSPADEARDVNARLEAYYLTPGVEPTPINLAWALRQAHTSAREYLNAEEEYVLAAVRLLIARHVFDPILFANSTTSVVATGTDGTFDTPLRILNELGVSQRLPDGGAVAARLVWDATEQLRGAATEQYRQAASLELSASVPLLRGAGPVAREDLIQSERDVVYAARRFEDFRRALLVSVASDYFDLAQQVAVIANQKRQLQSLLQLEERVAALVEAGRQAEFEKNIASNRVLQARSNLANQNERLQLALDRFKTRLGLSPDVPLALEPAQLELPEPETTPDAAAQAALLYRLDLQTTRDRVDDARRAVANAENGILPDLNLGGSVAARTKPGAREGGLVFETDDFIYTGSVTFGLPLDRENERLALRAAIIDLQRSQRDLDLSRDNAVIEARARVREIDRARFNLELAQQAVDINLRRQEELELKRDEVNTQVIVDAQNDLLDAENARDQAVTDLRNAVLQYLLSTGQLRVNRDGTLKKPGSEGEPAGDATLGSQPNESPPERASSPE